MFCSSCGSQNPPQLRFCRACGKPISSAESLAADGDDPLKTRLSIPAEQASLKSPAPQPSAGDSMATVVGMQAVKLPTPSSNAPDPFATQAGGGGGLNVAQLKELAAKSAANKPQAPANEPDSMATVVGMQAVKLPTTPPASNTEVDPLKTVVGPPKTPPPASSSASDPLATVVGMQAVDAATLAALSKPQPQKSPEPAKQENKPVIEKPKPLEKPILPPPNPDPVELKFSAPSPESSSSNVVIFVVIGVVVVIGIIVLVIFLK